MAYKLFLPFHSKTHPVSSLKPKLGSHVVPLPTLPLVEKDDEIWPKPKTILPRRVKRCMINYLISNSLVDKLLTDS